jgi:hypothetical protein
MKNTARILARRELARGELAQIALKHGCNIASLKACMKAKSNKQVSADECRQHQLQM